MNPRTTQTRLFPSGVQISQDGVYRYRLWREIGSGNKKVLFVMLNPSTADAFNDDPTIRRCLGYAKDWGYGYLEVVNLFAFRATDPKVLKKAADPVGPDNRDVLYNAVLESDLVICAWGSNADDLEQTIELTGLLRSCGTLHCLGVTKSGQPRHPLYLKKDAKILEFEVKE